MSTAGPDAANGPGGHDGLDGHDRRRAPASLATRGKSRCPSANRQSDCRQDDETLTIQGSNDFARNHLAFGSSDSSPTLRLKSCSTFSSSGEMNIPAFFIPASVPLARQATPHRSPQAGRLWLQRPGIVASYLVQLWIPGAHPRDPSSPGGIPLVARGPPRACVGCPRSSGLVQPGAWQWRQKSYRLRAGQHHHHLSPTSSRRTGSSWPGRGAASWPSGGPGDDPVVVQDRQTGLRHLADQPLHPRIFLHPCSHLCNKVFGNVDGPGLSPDLAGQHVGPVGQPARQAVSDTMKQASKPAESGLEKAEAFSVAPFSRSEACFILSKATWLPGRTRRRGGWAVRRGGTRRRANRRGGPRRSWPRGRRGRGMRRGLVGRIACRPRRP